jgi:hypothetical protein
MRLICVAAAGLLSVTIGGCGSSGTRQTLGTTRAAGSLGTTADATSVGTASAGDYCTSARQLVTDDPLDNQNFTSRQQVVDAATAASAQLHRLEQATSTETSTAQSASVSADYAQLVEAVSQLASDAQSAPDTRSFVAEAKGIDNPTLEKATDVIDAYTRAKCRFGIRRP